MERLSNNDDDEEVEEEEGKSSFDTDQTLLSCDRVINQDLLKEDLKCRICLGVLWQPKECKLCETSFCSPCLAKWLATDGNHSCPLKCSQEPKFRDKAHKVIRNMLSELTFRCKNHSSGCQEQVEYAYAIDHEGECEYDLQSCQGRGEGCTTVLIKRDIKGHEELCPLVPVECEFCRKRVKRSGLRTHFMSCEEAELECDMCKGVFKKKNYPIHASALCEEGIIGCGRCSGTYKRKYKEFHDCVRHLQNCLKTMTEEVHLLKDKIAERDKKYTDLESRVFYEMAELRKLILKQGDAP